MNMINKDIIDVDLTPMLNWIESQNKINPEGRTNLFTGKKREYGSQHTIEPSDIVFAPLIDKIYQIASSNFSNYMISDIWTNYNPPNGYNNKHVHVGSDISGCFYLYVPDNSGALQFENITIHPKEKEIYWWKSDLPHSVSKNESNETRISVAFNIQCG